MTGRDKNNSSLSKMDIYFTYVQTNSSWSSPLCSTGPPEPQAPSNLLLCHSWRRWPSSVQLQIARPILWTLTTEGESGVGRPYRRGQQRESLSRERADSLISGSGGIRGQVPVFSESSLPSDISGSGGRSRCQVTERLQELLYCYPC